MPTLAEACAALGVNRVTLRKWLARLKIEPTRHEFDTRFWLITDDELEAIRKIRADMPTVTRTPNMPPAFTRAKSDGLASSAVAFPVPAPQKRRQQPVSASFSPAQVALREHPLPEGWMAVSTFCRQHGLNDRSILRSGHMPTPTYAPEGKPWGSFSPRAHIYQRVEIAYTATQLRAAVEIARDKWADRWHDCPECPHELAAAADGAP